MLLKKFQLGAEFVMEYVLQAESPRNDQEECKECGFINLNKTNLKRHRQSVHNKRRAIKSAEGMITMMFVIF